MIAGLINGGPRYQPTVSAYVRDRQATAKNGFGRRPVFTSSESFNEVPWSHTVGNGRKRVEKSLMRGGRTGERTIDNGPIAPGRLHPQARRASLTPHRSALAVARSRPV